MSLGVEMEMVHCHSVSGSDKVQSVEKSWPVDCQQPEIQFRNKVEFENIYIQLTQLPARCNIII